MKPTNVLFVTWDGPQSSYLEGLFLPVFQILARHGFAVHVVQFTWGEKGHRLALKKFCEDQKIIYRDVTVLRRPRVLGSLVMLVWGQRHIHRAIRDLDINIVMPRGIITALMTMLTLRHFPSVGLLLDADGLPYDERVDFNGWSPNSLAYRFLRDMEAYAVRCADVVLTRSKKAVDILVARAGAGVDPGKFYVVGNGRDESLFSPGLSVDRIEVRHSLGISNSAPLLVFVGSSMEGKYCGREMLDFFRLVLNRREDARLLLLTGSPNEANTILAAYEDLRSRTCVMRLAFHEIPRFLTACDLGLAFIRPSFSMQAAAAIKMGEYLLCGLPVLATRGIGDTEKLVTDKVGFVLETMSLEELADAADWFVQAVMSYPGSYVLPCREAGLKYYSFEASVNVYASALNAVRSL